MALRWGLVGLGALAKQLAPAFASAGNAELVACASRSHESAKAFAEAHGISRVHPSYEELVRDPYVDAVYVATPNHLHHAVVLAAAGQRKHVLCEKPMAPTVREADDMISACQSAKVRLGVGFYLRFLPVARVAVDAVRAGQLGVVREFTMQRYSSQTVGEMAAWRRELRLAGGGVLMDVGVHLLDLAHYILGRPVSQVFALAYPPRPSGLPDDTTTVLLEFSGGCQAILRCSRGLPAGANDLEIFGSGGRLFTGPLRWTGSYEATVQTAASTEVRRFPVEDLYRLEIEAFGEELAGARTPLATGEEGRELVRITEAAVRSLETGAAVRIDG